MSTCRSRRAQLVGLIGPNGAGKTSFIDAITGLTAATGRVELAGEDISALSPERRARHGLARTWQAAELFDDLSVRENLNVTAGRPSVGQAIKEILTGRAGRHPIVDHTLEVTRFGRRRRRHPRVASAKVSASWSA